MTEICIFPIPGCVTFPGTEFPLHVFEPRYRDMINRCLQENKPVAICHTQSMISAGRQTDNLKEALSSNQATYRPYDVFSAGLCELTDTTKDGRMYLTVHIHKRYHLGQEIQRLPYQIYDCEEFPDRIPTEQEKVLNAELKEKILRRLNALMPAEHAAQNPLAGLLASDEWQQMDAEDFSFRIFGLIRFEADILQQCLEMDNAAARLEQVLTLLNQN